MQIVLGLKAGASLLVLLLVLTAFRGHHELVTIIVNVVCLPFLAGLCRLPGPSLSIVNSLLLLIIASGWRRLSIPLVWPPS